VAAGTGTGGTAIIGTAIIGTAIIGTAIICTAIGNAILGTAVARAMSETATLIRVRGLVQGVGFRPTMWRLAQRHGLRGWVANDGDGVRMHVCGPAAAVEGFVLDLPGESPPLARIDQIDREPAPPLPQDAGFHIAESAATAIRTGVAPDAATCAECVQEIFDPFARRYRYPFTNCTHCGPRLSIIRRIPYDRAHTSMAEFAMCAACAAEYHDPANRRFHAQPIACHVCGPTLTLRRADGRAMTLEAFSALDAADAACTLLQRGYILAIQGLGGYQLACDATQPETVARMRHRKRRERKPFALMARDVAVIRRHARVTAEEAALLATPAAPIVLLARADLGAPSMAAGSTRSQLPRDHDAVAEGVAPALDRLGFMLPNTPLHHLMLKRMQRPIVLTSGNSSDEPQAIEAADARRRLGHIAEYFLEHDRPIERRVDDSVARIVGGRPRLLRRARGYAPASIPLPPGFEAAPRVLGFGGELKNTFCIMRDGAAVMSPHLGDLQDALTRADHHKALADFRGFFDFAPQALACDLHPDYSSSQQARAEAAERALPLLACQHHHAHIAACLIDNEVPLDAPPVIGVALDGIGYGDDGTLWGGEFLLADYGGYRRLGTFKPVALLGGEAAVREPWRNTYAHIMAQMGWASFAMNYADLELYRFLERQPRALFDGMLARRVNAPLASSCGRLFDAAAAAMGLARERAWYEGQGAVEMEAAVDFDCLYGEDERLDYPFPIPRLGGLPYIEPLGMWAALFGDLILETPIGVMAARFHRGLANTLVRMIEKLSEQVTGSEAHAPRAEAPSLHPGTPATTAPRGGARRPAVALSGGVFQNRILFERVSSGLAARGYSVLSHSRVPCNDGGLALGQAAIAAARMLRAAH
jgi:hydrogenase maturation protein HypF